MTRIIAVFLLMAATFGCGKVATAETSDEFGSPLQIWLADVRPSGGKVIVALYGSKEAFANDGEPVAWFGVPVTTERVTVSDLPPGRYAIAAFHDTNGNLEPDIAADGLPAEGWGHSGGLGQWDEPTFDRASFEGREAEVVFHYRD